MDPSSIDIPKSSVYLSHDPNYWVAISDTLRHDGLVHKLPFNLDTLKCKSKLGLKVKFSGDLHIFLNDKDEGKICGGVNVNKPLYGLVDLAGKAVKVQSMFYSGRLHACITLSNYLLYNVAIHYIIVVYIHIVILSRKN